MKIGYVKMSKYIHTFAIIAYRHSIYLKDCIESIINQTLNSNIYISTSTPSFELLNLAKAYNLRLYIDNKPYHKGIGSDWSDAYKLAVTKYVTLAHQDDLYDPKYTECCLDYAEKYSDNLITFSDYTELYGDKIRKNSFPLLVKRTLILPFYFRTAAKSKTIKKSILKFGSPICCPSVMYNKLNIGDFEFNTNLKINLDWDTWLYFANLEGSFVFIDKPLVQHRIHDQSATSAGIANNQRLMEDQLLFYRLWPKYFANILLSLYKKSYKFNE